MVLFFFLLSIAVLIAVSVVLLKQFDKIAGRGPKQVADGIRLAGKDAPPSDEMRKLADLKSSGLISDEEYEAKRQEILSRL